MKNCKTISWNTTWATTFFWGQILDYGKHRYIVTRECSKLDEWFGVSWLICKICKICVQAYVQICKGTLMKLADAVLNTIYGSRTWCQETDCYIKILLHLLAMWTMNKKACHWVNCSAMPNLKMFSKSYIT